MNSNSDTWERIHDRDRLKRIPDAALDEAIERRRAALVDAELVRSQRETERRRKRRSKP